MQTYSLLPASPREGEAVTLRIDDTDGCFFAEQQLPLIQRNGELVAVRIGLTDAIPPGGCPAEWVTPRHFPLGTFEAGNYAVQLTLCTNAPPPDDCNVVATMPLSVLGTGGTHSVPALSAALVTVLILAVAAVGLFGARRASA